MAKTLSKSGIGLDGTIEAWHVSQSVDALTGTENAYDITISGSLNVTGPIAGTAGVTNTLTSSYAITASHALNAADSAFTAAGISGSWQAQTSSMTVATASYAGQLYGSPNIIVSGITSSGDVHISDLKHIRIDGSGRSGIYSNRFTINHSVDASGYFQVHSGSGATVVSQFASKTGGGSGIALGDGSNGGSGINDLKVYGNSLFTSHITSSANIKVDGTISNVSTTHVTASGNISSSGTITGNTGSFTYLQGNSPINVISPLISNLNGTKTIEVSHSGDFPTPSGTQVTLEENTTYVIRGNVNMSDTIFASGSGISLYGIDRNKDGLTYTSSSTFITVENSDFTMQNLKLSATNTSSLVLSGSDYTAGSYNQGRLKVMEINNCQFRNCGNVADFKGYDLIDINNTLFWYIQAPTIGLRFQDTSKTEISSCELIRWFDETTIPSPSGWATCPMIRFRENGAENVGLGAINVNTCVIHPQVQQDGISVSTGSTTGAGGTISSNTFVAGNLTTGSLIAESSFDSGSILKWDFGLNQGVADSNAYGMGYFEGLTASQGGATYSLIGVNGAFSSSNSQRMSISSSGEMTYNGTKPIYVSIGAGVTFISDGTGNHDFSLYKSGSGFPNAELSGSRGGVVSIPNNDGATVSVDFSTTLNNGDKIGIYGKTTAIGYEITNAKLSIKE